MVKNYGAEIDSIIGTPWDSTNSETVPRTESVKLNGGAKIIQAVYLYADLAKSSLIAKLLDRRVAAKILKAFLNSSANCIIENDGEVLSFDGDRVLGVFVGDRKNTNAAKTALKINYVVSKLMRPKFEASFSTVRDAPFKLAHGVGIDSGETLIVRGGVRGNNDLVSIGRAPNLAAKMSDIRDSYPTYITEAVFNKLADEAKFGGAEKKLMWEKATWTFLDDRLSVYRSNWTWKP